VSIYTHSEFKSVIQAPHVDVIQIPFNLLNHWGVNGALIKEAKQAAKEIHVRSVFLQGLFFMDPEKLPVHLQGLRPELKKLREIASSYGVSMAQMALTYASHFDAIDRILIGVETAAQLREVIGYLGRPLPKDCADRVSQIIVEHSHLIDPSQWARLAK
jgi:aryl-alcohol dehydrogenase-like predicted oxidoreductase